MKFAEIKTKKPCYLALEDGMVFEGKLFGFDGEKAGEVVFNTSMTGYQEILTDPSYAGQIVTMTYPHIGNYGVNFKDQESARPFVEGFVVRESSSIYSNFRATESLEDYLLKHKITAIEGIDTRMLVKHIRSAGAMKGVLSSIDLSKESLVKKAKESPSLVGLDLVQNVSTDKAYRSEQKNFDFFVVAYDLGIKKNILKRLNKVGFNVEVVPAKTSVDEVLAKNPDAVFLSNGPGDPAAVSYAIENVKNLLGKVPVFGICLGHQIMALALGVSTYKLKFGHRGANQPVKNLITGKVEITAQNHGFAVKGPDKGFNFNGHQVNVTHLNLNDNTIEGLDCPSLKAFCVQYHPEASPGPHDSFYLFEQFKELVMKEKNAKR